MVSNHGKAVGRLLAMNAPRLRSILLTVPGIAAALAVGAPAGPPAAVAAAPATAAHQDFNGDGYQDLVVGAPGGTVGGRAGAGYITVLYGSAHGVSAASHLTVSRATAGVPGDATAGQGFGADTAAADLDGDGYTDLVAGGPHNADAVIVWGGPAGLTGGTPVPGHGNLVQTGDYNGDGHPDLVALRTGIPAGDDPSGSEGLVWNGPVSRTGVPATTSLFTGEQYHDLYGAASGDVNGDGRDDLAFTEYTGDGGFGTALFLGGAGGPGDRGTPVKAAADSHAAVTIGDVNGDGLGDLVLGNTGGDAGEVTVAYGAHTGLSPEADWTTITQDTPGVPGSAEPGDGFGAALSAGDVDGDGIDDIAVGAPYEDLGSVRDAGYVTLLRGSAAGLTGSGAQAFSQDTANVPGTAEADDRFSSAVRLLDINGNGYADLASAAVNEDGGNGAVWVLRGRPDGLVTDAAVVAGPIGAGAPAAKAAFGQHLG